jgi:hypothetical protein
MCRLWPKRQKVAEKLEAELAAFSAGERHLPGIADLPARRSLAMQMVASLRRLDYTEKVRNRPISPGRANPENALFDPERAAMLHAREGRVDEAFWLIFLATHFGKHPAQGWERLRDVYSGLGTGIWTWDRTSGDPAAFRLWLRENEHRIGGGFGNHRKYETLRSGSPNGTAAVIESYINWVGPARSHAKFVGELVRTGGNHPHVIFGHFYNSMNVRRFGRLAKFEFLALIGRLDLAPIAPGSAYLKGATGPLEGARLLFGGDRHARIAESTLEDGLRELDAKLQVGMQVMEDSICNWQKSPARFVHFRG